MARPLTKPPGRPPGDFSLYGRVSACLDDVLIGDGCWEYMGRISWNGYGRLDLGPKPNGTSSKDRIEVPAHRFMYETFRGKIPSGLFIDHKCRNRKCVNPDHLDPVTCQENLLRGETLAAANAKKTHCVNGHEFTTENTKLYKSRKSPVLARGCKACSRIRSRR